ncbi:MAG: right-handed parallel beta-helix repeat-containing protein [Thermoanaerobaculia bacterium]|nr:right-handed parallel beta-helix repeat-containing protein [Thermoanaerobaculia bacterium]
MALRTDGVLVALVGLGCLAIVPVWLESLRPPEPGQTNDATINVTSGSDAGPGSLREAIFAADRSLERAKVVLLASEIELRNALPPIANPHGVVIEAGPGGSSIDVRAVVDAVGIDIDGPRTVLRGFSVVGGSVAGIRVRGANALLIDVSVSGASTAILGVEGAQGLRIVGCQLSDNNIGIRIDPAAAPVSIESCRFSGHREAAIWSAGPERTSGSVRQLSIRDNHFDRDRIGVLVGHVGAEVVDNEFEASVDSAVHLIGGARIHRNHISGAVRVGIFAEEPTANTLIENNEIRASPGVAILSRLNRGATIRENRLYNNAYGIIDVLSDPVQPGVISRNLLTSQSLDGIVIVGGSPLLRSNRILRSRGAGLRALDLIEVEGNRVVASPRVEDNQLEGNASDEMVRGVYDARDEVGSELP